MEKAKEETITDDQLPLRKRTQTTSWEIRREMDELKSAMKEKLDQNLDRMVRRKDSPFTMAILECPVPSKFCLQQLESFDNLQDPLDHLNAFKTTLSCRSCFNRCL